MRREIRSRAEVRQVSSYRDDKAHLALWYSKRAVCGAPHFSNKAAVGAERCAECEELTEEVTQQ